MGRRSRVILPCSCSLACTLAVQSTHKHHPALAKRKNKHSFTLQSFLGTDNGEKKAENKEGTVLSITWPSGCLQSKTLQFLNQVFHINFTLFQGQTPGECQSGRLHGARLVEKFITGCMSKQNCKNPTSNLALLQIAPQSKDGDGFPWEKGLLILCFCFQIYITFHVFSITQEPKRSRSTYLECPSLIFTKLLISFSSSVL